MTNDATPTRAQAHSPQTAASSRLWRGLLPLSCSAVVPRPDRTVLGIVGRDLGYCDGYRCYRDCRASPLSVPLTSASSYRAVTVPKEAEASARGGARPPRPATL